MADAELLTLPEAARLASKHADDEITPADFLRAAARGAILLKAVCPRNVTMRPCRPGDEPRQLVQGSKPTLPLIACELLSENGRATWRTMDWFEPHVIRIPRSRKVQARIEAVEPREAETAPRQQQASESAAAPGAKAGPPPDHPDPAAKGIKGNWADDDEGPGELCRFTRWRLDDSEPDLQTVPEDCRVSGMDVHALADDYARARVALEAPGQPPVAPAPVAAAPVINIFYPQAQDTGTHAPVEATSAVEKGANEAESVKPIQRGAAQDAAILKQIKVLGHDPLNLPPNRAGKPGTKAAVRAALKRDRLFTGAKVFDKAWERLTENSDIVIKK